MVAKHVEEMQKRSEELNDKLSPMAYAGKQVRILLVQMAGLLGGGGIGFWLGGIGAKTMRVPKFVADLMAKGDPEAIEKLAAVEVPKKMVGATIGVFVGTVITTLVLGYEHWVKGEAERLAVDEINRDVAESKLRMNPELQRENKLLREMVEKQDAQLQVRDAHQPAATITAKDAVVEASENARGAQETVLA